MAVKEGKLHVPSTGPDGVFQGEQGGNWTQQRIFFDDNAGVVYTGMHGIDHDNRVIRVRDVETDEVEPLKPSAIRLEYTKERRNQRYPSGTYEKDGEKIFYSEWSYADGQEVQVEKRDGGINYRTYFDRLYYYDERGEKRDVIRVDQQKVTVYDFQWEFTIERATGSFYPYPSWWNSDPAPAKYTADSYRTLRILDYTPLGDIHIRHEYIQGKIKNVLISGNRSVGWIDANGPYDYEITAIRGYDYYLTTDGERSLNGTYVDMWVTIAHLQQYEPGGRPSTGTTEVNPNGNYVWTIRRQELSPEDETPVLRDIILTPWPAAPDDPEDAFTACDGKIKVVGQRRDNAELEGRKLEAFGHTFEGGSWAAIRDAPKRDENGKITDWNTVLVLHMGEDAVTAIREDGSAESIPREVFFHEVLRVPLETRITERTVFSPVGTMYNTWPADRAWVTLEQECRAVTLHEAWRDSQVNSPNMPSDEAPPGAPPPPAPVDPDAPVVSLYPAHWYWKKRPRQRPKKLPLPQDAPKAPLRLTLADVSAQVRTDERLKRGEAPLQLPKTATVNGENVLPIVAKKFYFPPAEWDEELDDKKNTAGPLTLTFDLPDPPRSPNPEMNDPGETWAAALMLRLRTTAPTIKVNGKVVRLGRLGHNADEKKGWHPYVVQVPVSASYTVEFQGACSRALLCVRVMPNESAGVAS